MCPCQVCQAPSKPPWQFFHKFSRSSVLQMSNHFKLLLIDLKTWCCKTKQLFFPNDFHKFKRWLPDLSLLFQAVTVFFVSQDFTLGQTTINNINILNIFITIKDICICLNISHPDNIVCPKLTSSFPSCCSSARKSFHTDLAFFFFNTYPH